MKRDEMKCRHCWNDICVVTNKTRDLTKVRLMGEVETIWTETRGFLVEEHKTLSRRKVIKELVPLEFAERLLKNPDNLIFLGFITNNCERTSQMLGLAPPSTVKRFYYEKTTAKRDLLSDLKLVAEGYKIVHEIDSEKQKAAVKRKEREEREQKKKQRIKKRLKEKNTHQVSIEDFMGTE